MKITVEFNSLEEISEFQKIYVAGNNVIEDFIAEEVAKHFKEEPAAAPKKEKKAEPKEEVPEEEPEEEEDAPKVDVEDLKLKARKALAKVNKQTKENTAKEWISDKGYDSLADIEDPDILTELIDKAEEFLDA